jgi:shikimate kinase
MAYEGMDASIVRRAGMPIPQIVENFGWAKFRDIETEVAFDLSGKEHKIIDTGGGVIERPENIAALNERGTIFWLKASVDTIVRRIAGDDQRPALIEGKTFTQEVAEVLEDRTPKYRSAAHYEIETDDLTPAQVAEKIIILYNQN